MVVQTNQPPAGMLSQHKNKQGIWVECKATQRACRYGSLSDHRIVPMNALTPVATAKVATPPPVPAVAQTTPPPKPNTNIQLEQMLVLVDPTSNNNKFYHVILDDKGNLITRWGRVGSQGTSKTESYKSRWDFEDTIRGKERRGYKKTNIVSTGVKIDTTTSNIKDAAQQHLAADSDPQIVQLIDTIVRLNKHQIMANSGGMITISDDGQVKTALGLVDEHTIDQAQLILNRLYTYSSAPVSQRQRNDDIAKYLTLIPQKVGARKGWDDDFVQSENLQKQQAFLTQLSDSIDWYKNKKTQAIASSNGSRKVQDIFRMKLTKASKQEFDHVNEIFTKSKNSMHTDVKNAKLKAIYKLTDTEADIRFDKVAKEIGNVKELWHGTSGVNVLSLLSKGYIIPKATDGIKTQGAMFGSGVYTSDQSSKSLRYSTGAWGSQKTGNTSFMFLNEVAMGNEFRPSRWDSTSYKQATTGRGKTTGKAYNSISVKGGTCGVLNNEMIVWNLDQIKMKYLCEFEV